MASLIEMAMTDALLRSSQSLPELRSALGEDFDLSELEAYLSWRELGVRTRIGRPLANFANVAACWPFEQRRTLLRWAGEPWIAAAGYEPTSTFSMRGHPMFRRVMAPTLREWRAREPSDAEADLLACLWDEPAQAGAGERIGCLRMLLERHRDYLPARRALIRAQVDRVGFNQHEWPHGYLGDPADDARYLLEMKTELHLVPRDEWCEQMIDAIADLYGVASDAARRREAAGTG